ncbi:hypothetical protein M885DRAFT_624052 [Pelagophyceae sp. CCMP2097]|nr:hypothetical protein M885DRAFT_624052 [Pelagophyceae sp. CCMP2097]
MRLPIVVRLRRLERSNAVERRAVRALFDDGAAEMHDGAADESDGGDAAAMGGPSDDPRDDGATEQQRPFTAVLDLTTQERASLLCGDNADEVYSRCEVRVWPEQCAAAKTERRWQLRGMSSSRHLNTLRDVNGADRPPQVTGPISVFGTFSLWVQDFDAVYRTKQKADLMMSALLLRV